MAHLEDNPQTAFAFKNSWQCPERDNEGKILREGTQRGVTNVARRRRFVLVTLTTIFGTVFSRDWLLPHAVAPTATADALTTPDATVTTVMANVTTAGNAVATATTNSTAITPVVGKASADDAAVPRRRRPTAQQGKKTPRVQQLCQSETRSSKKGYGNSTGDTGNKRRPNQLNKAEERSAKRSRSESQASIDKAPPNWIHRRVIVQVYGQPIYKVSSPGAPVAAVESCIQSHESLKKAGFSTETYPLTTFSSAKEKAPRSCS